MPDIQDSNAEIAQNIKYLQDSIYVISGKWKLPILTAVHQGKSRFRDIQRTVDGITSKVLSKELKELEMNKLMVRIVYDDSPTIVEYTVSNYCDSLQNVVAELIEWGKHHRDKIRED